MRVGKPTGHVEPELVIKVHILVCKLDQFVLTFDDKLLLKERIKQGIKFIFDAFNQEWISIL